MSAWSETVQSRPLSKPLMLRVSLVVELLRSRPAFIFWAATLGPAAVWVAVPALFYGAPPGDVPRVLAVGHEWRLGSPFGPPLAGWAAELAFDLAGHNVVGIYLLSQLCVVVTFWAVLALGRSIVGTHHAVMAVLLTAGIAAFSLPALEFGPPVLAMPLTALALMCYWRAARRRRRGYWLALGVDLGLLVLASYAGLILVGLMVLHAVLSQRSRAALATPEPWIAGLILVAILLPHLVCAGVSGSIARPSFAAISSALVAPGGLLDWLRVAGWILAFHGGFIALLVVAGGVLVGRGVAAPAFERAPIDPAARRFIYLFALLPGLASTVLAVLVGSPVPVGGVAPLVVLSGLAVVVAAGDVIRLHRQNILGRLWVALLLVPPATAALAVVFLPWTVGVAPGVDRPAAAMGRFFTETFRHRTGQPLAIVTGEADTAALVAMASEDRPSLFFANNPELSPWVTEDAIRDKGAVVVWPVSDNAGMPPAAIKSRFPGLVPEVPRSFDRPVQGRLSLYRIGWAVIRPRGQPAGAAPSSRAAASRPR